MTTNTSGAHPLVGAYLADLERALAPADPQERADVLAAVAEHIHDALGDSQDAAQATAVLAALGPVERIAAAATPSPAPADSAPTSSSAHLDWMSALLLVCATISFALAFTRPLVAIPIAVGALVGTLTQLRRHRGHRRVLRASLGLSLATLLITVFMGMFLLSASPGDPVPGDVQTVQPDVP